MATFIGQMQQLQTDYIVRSVTIVKVPMPLVVQVTNMPGYTAQVGTESTFVIDATSTYDPDSPGSGLTFIWTCPTGVFGCNRQSPTLAVSKAMRVQAGLNQVGSTFSVMLQVYSSTKVSEIFTLTLSIVKQNYTLCMQVKLQNSLNDQFGIAKDQEFPVQLKLSTEKLCDNLIINSIAWSTIGSPFWIVSPDQSVVSIISASSLPSNLTRVNARVVFTATDLST